MSNDLAAALAARRRRPQAVGVDTRKARAEAHRRLRVERGAEAATYTRQAASAVLDPVAEFASRAAWRAWLDHLYPAWAAEIGEACYGAPLVVIAPDEPPRAYSRPAARLDLAHFAALGLLDAAGMWVTPTVGDPLPDAEADYVPSHVCGRRCPHSAATRFAWARAAPRDPSTVPPAEQEK
ncbi:hypothetical protein OG836_26175 [Micromonospora zamorensis]|uniref:hypothetical protein n=1 Tax=Micromonospora zamorensis TaxID=709883 RepID=UPI002E1A425B